MELEGRLAAVEQRLAVFETLLEMLAGHAQAALRMLEEERPLLEELRAWSLRLRELAAVGEE